MLMKIALIEDNKTLLEAINKKLTNFGFVVDSFDDGEDGLFALQTFDYDLLILDLGLPNIDGTQIVKELRAKQKDIPILIISARSKLEQRILGLDLGADDYLCKPFALDEVVARVQALLRRSKRYLEYKIEYNDLEFDTKSRVLRKNSSKIELTKKELDIFEYLLININKVIPKEDIVEHISSIDEHFTSDTIIPHISRIRKKLGKSIDLKSIRGLGYILS